jgi:hypothetical protein
MSGTRLSSVTADHGTPAAGTPPGPERFYLVEVMTEKNIAKCVTCGTELHPERARKYNYCMSPECQAKNLKGLTMVAVGVNKSAEQYLLLDDETKAELADGKYHDQRRGTFGRPAPAPAPATPAKPAVPPAGPATQPAPGTGTSRRPPRPAPARSAGPRQPGTPSQRRLAVLYNQQGLRPDEIARKLGLTRYEVTQIILAARGHGKL